MEIGISIVVLIIIWLAWSRYTVYRNIRKAFDSVEVNKPFSLSAPLREVVGYCYKHNLEFQPILSLGYLIVEYNQKVITVKQEGSYRMGNSYLVM